MSELMPELGSDSVVETEDKEYFCYATGAFYKDKEKTKAIPKKGTVKGKFSYYDFGKAYLTMVSKNSVRAMDAKPKGREYFAEDLIRTKFYYLTLNQLKRRVKIFLNQLEDRGVVVNELDYKSEAIKKAAKKKTAPKNLDDLIAEMGEFQGIHATKSAIKKSTKAVRADTVSRREAYNDKHLENLLDGGSTEIKKVSYSVKITLTPDLEKWKKQFSGTHRGSTQDLDEKPFIKNENFFQLFVAKQGRAAQLTSDEFYSWMVKFHQKKFS